MSVDEPKIFQEIDEIQDDLKLKELIKECVDASRTAGDEMFKTSFKPNPRAADDVSEEALAKILQSGKVIHDIRVDTDISNCLVFHTTNLETSVVEDDLLQLRRCVDQAVEHRVLDLFSSVDSPSMQVSGHFWYPPGGYMGWHTNLRKPGWRLYVTYAEEPGKSFFRYRDPTSGQIVTSVDRQWDFRLFQIRADAPFWHAVYSDTHRFSLGYKIELEPAPTP